ncbi:MAG: signal peptidase I [Proteobacteria bacterium]|nr:signal peptidase I [Pseudomonadota bacterium]
MDFALFLFLALLVTGVIWAWDAFMMKPGREARAKELKNAGGTEESFEKMRQEPLAVEYARTFFPVILFVFVLRSFLVEPFRIPSGSMLPNLLVGDFILVNKFTYGVRLPVVNKKIISINEPARGDVLVFRYPRQPSVNYIKRVVGLPGDRISYHNKKLTINGQPVDYKDDGSFVLKNGDGGERKFGQRMETFGDNVHRIIIEDNEYFTNARDFEVPEGQYFVMGDNRDNSNDSRYWGTVPEENLVGRAFLVWFSWDLNMKLDHILWNRIGNSIN